MASDAVSSSNGRPRERRLADHTNYVNCVRYSPDGSVFCSVGSDKKIILYEGKEGQKLRELKAADAKKHPQGSVYSCAFSADGAKLLTASADKVAGGAGVMPRRALCFLDARREARVDGASSTRAEGLVPFDLESARVAGAPSARAEV